MLFLLKIVMPLQIEFPELSSDSESDISDVSIDLVVYFPEPEQHYATPLCVTERRGCSVAQVRKSLSCVVLCIVNCKLRN